MEAAASVAASADMEVGIVAHKDTLTYLSTGSTLLNLALTDKADGGWLAGRFYNIIGDSSSGKSFMCLTSLAEAAHDPKFDDYRIIYDDVEVANTFDVANLFGKLADRMEAPRYEDDEPIYSNTVEDFYANVMRLCKEGTPFIYVLDSVDALTSNSELDRAEEFVDAQEKGKEVKGSYKMDKAKLLTEILRVITTEIAKTNSIVLAISQTRDNIDPRTSMFTPKTRAGGKALKFFATGEMWLAHMGNINNAKYERKIGDRTKIKVSKNKVTGKCREVPLTLLYSYGIDDVQENLNFLIDTNNLPKVSAQKFDATRICHMEGTKQAILDCIYGDREYQKKLAKECEKVWVDIEKACIVQRPSRY
jgi:RecA/RadA recombinase